MDFARVLFTNFHVQAVMLIVSRREPSISVHEEKHLKTDKAFHDHIYKHLNGSDTCLSDCSEECFKIIDLASTVYIMILKS